MALERLSTGVGTQRLGGSEEVWEKGPGAQREAPVSLEEKSVSLLKLKGRIKREMKQLKLK